MSRDAKDLEQAHASLVTAYVESLRDSQDTCPPEKRSGFAEWLALTEEYGSAVDRGEIDHNATPWSEWLRARLSNR